MAQGKGMWNKPRLVLMLGLVVLSGFPRRMRWRSARSREVGRTDVRDLAATPAAPAVDATFSDAGLLEPEVRGERAARDRGHSSAENLFWDAYASDRRSLLSRGVRAVEQGGGGQAGAAGVPVSASPASQRKPTKYLVYVPPKYAGLGNRMAGMMGTFALSIAWERVFFHEWTEREVSCGATYTDLFVPPFRSWSVSPASAATGGDQEPATRGVPDVSSEAERERCHLDLTQFGVDSGEFDRIFIENRGDDPREDCPVLFIRSNQNFAEFVASDSFGHPKVGSAPLSEWLQPGNITTTLFAGLFRPVAHVRQKVADGAARLFPPTGKQTMAAHVRSNTMKDAGKRELFIDCLLQLTAAKKISSVVVSTDIPNFSQEKYADRLNASGINLVSAMEGVMRSNEQNRMRATVENMRDALTELLLIGNADVVITSEMSSFSALAAAAGGQTTQRIGGSTCSPIDNEPEFHRFCADRHFVDFATWRSIYPFADSNLARCNSRRRRS